MSQQDRFEENNLVSRFLDGELSPEEEKVALHLIAENDQLRSMLRFDRFLSESLRKEPVRDLLGVPDEFTDSVMNQIHKMEEDTLAQESWFDAALHTINGWFEPKEYSFRPALVYIVPAVLLIAYAGFFKGNDPQIAFNSVAEVPAEVNYASQNHQNPEKVWIRFVYIDEDAEQVSVAGNFSDWDPVEMSSQIMNGKKVWSGLVAVERGEHHYMFIKDGEEWISDPLAEVQRDDGFGNKNAVIYL